MNLNTKKHTCSRCAASRHNRCDLGYRSIFKSDEPTGVRAVGTPLENCPKPLSNKDLFFALKYYKAEGVVMCEYCGVFRKALIDVQTAANINDVKISEYTIRMGILNICRLALENGRNCCDGPKDEKIKELQHALKCSEISLNGYRDYLHDMVVVEMNGKIYRGVPGDGFTGKWEMLHKHKDGNTWISVQNYQIKSDLNKQYAGSTGAGETE